MSVAPSTRLPPPEKLQLPSPISSSSNTPPLAMHKLSRTSLAAVVCPSAPFLAPRLLRATVPTALRTLQGAPCYATTTAPKGKKPQHKFPTRPEKQLRARAAHDGVSALLEQLNKACDVHNATLIMDLYPRLLNAGALDRDATRRIAQSLHFRARQKGKDGKDMDMILFILQMMAHIRSGVLAPTPSSSYTCWASSRSTAASTPAASSGNGWSSGTMPWCRREPTAQPSSSWLTSVSRPCPSSRPCTSTV